MSSFLQTFEEYICVDVIESAWHWFNKKLKAITTFDELLKCHEEFLEQRILDRSMMGRKQTKVASFLIEIFVQVQLFAQKVSEYTVMHDSGTEEAEEIWDELRQAVETYEDKSRFFATFVTQLSTRGYYRELNSRLQQHVA